MENALDDIQLIVGKKKNRPHITLSLSAMPKDCSECPLYKMTEYQDEDFIWIHHYCPFGGNNWGCLMERPENCPIQENDE